jgi:flagellar biosynthetic protein FliP
MLAKKSYIYTIVIFGLTVLPIISYGIEPTSPLLDLKDFFNNPQFSSPTFSGRLLQIFTLISVLGIAPSLIIATTSFVRIIIVFSIVRTALGLQQSPPNQILNALALFLTFFIMKPVFEQAYSAGLEPMILGKMSEEKAVPIIIKPFKEFMLANTRSKDIDLFNGIAKLKPDNIQDTPLHVILPAFMISELHKAFALGFLIFLPFFIIDIVVSSILMSLGMIMMSPVMVSLPLKVIFFVLIDGWSLLVGSIIKSFRF